ncbi:hypothetical protein PBRA_008671 [Plasmodiophora brassicae]|uniref:NEDD8-activating enzyme E1 catalytic subunit n=1 Tax=Plasmodiophora brassicae TaxID=37360 RepID=A0A0G4J302_PLABS|nr:hypothetical protein PBRA_008671 [Plasmodiophora brassicae]
MSGADVVAEDEWPARWASLRTALTRSSALTPPTFRAGRQVIPASDDRGSVNLATLSGERKVLVVGAGGLGCEILKNLALSGFADIHVVDIDTIELSNLNRQFLFRQSDIGRPKADVAAEFVMRRCPGVRITPHCKKIQELPKDYYSQFFIVIAGLDNVTARRWLNATLVELVELDDDGDVDVDSIIPLIDGGTEGFKGQARLFFPRITSCYECSVGTLPTQRRFAICTLANVPRLPEHCVAYALEVEWPKLAYFKSSSDFGFVSDRDSDSADGAVQLDTDNVEHMRWLFERAARRAVEYNIGGVTYSLTMQVVKNIIPAIAATNAIIAAACVNEALKVATWMSQPLSNYFMFSGHEGVYARTFDFARNPDCIVCGARQASVDICRSSTVLALVERLQTDPVLKLADPALATEQSVLWIPSRSVRAMYEANLDRTLEDALGLPPAAASATVYATDKQTLGDNRVVIRIRFTSDPVTIGSSAA